VKDPIAHAVERFENGFSCSQSILMAFSPQLGLPEMTASRIASTFGGGIARRGDTCGAVSGSLMVLGLKYGPSEQSDKEEIYEKANEFIERFEGINGNINCRKLISLDISQPEQLQAARESKVFKTICPKLVQSAARILVKLMEESQ